MVLEISASVVGTSDPRTVQVVASGLTVGEAYEIRGSWAGGSWMVRGGVGVATEAQVILGDAATPVNTDVTYAVLHAGQAAASSPLVVEYAGQYVLQTLDAQTALAFEGRDNAMPRQVGIRQALFFVAGRPDPVVLYDTATLDSGSWDIITTPEQSRTLRTLLTVGAPLILRTDGNVRDLAAVEYVIITAASSTLLGDEDDRVWVLAYQVIDDPEPGTVVSTSTWTQFDGAYDGLTWNTFNTEWAGLTWDDFDVEDWATRVSVINPTFGFGFGPYGTYPFGQ